MLPYELKRSYLRVAEPLGAVSRRVDCQDVICPGPFCRPPPPPVYEHRRVFRLRAIRPELAVSLGGSSRRILMRQAVCGAAEQPWGLKVRLAVPLTVTERALLSCLRAASRP